MWHFAILAQINPEKSREEFRTINQKNGGTGVKDFMDGMGLGILAEQVHGNISGYFCYQYIIPCPLRSVITVFLFVISLNCSVQLLFYNYHLYSLLNTAWGVKTWGVIGHTATRIGWSYSNFKGKKRWLRTFGLPTSLVSSSCSFWFPIYMLPQVIQFLEAPEYSMFSRIVFDTAPTVKTISLWIQSWLSTITLWFASPVDRAIHSGYYLCQTSLMHPLGRSWRYNCLLCDLLSC